MESSCHKLEKSVSPITGMMMISKMLDSHHCWTLAYLLSFFQVIEAEVTLTTSSTNIAENSPLTLTCSYSGSLTIETYQMRVNAVSTGSLLDDCTVFASEPDPALYEYSCPTNRQLTWTIKKVTRANEGDSWKCVIGFTASESGSGQASFTINVQVPIQRITMTSPTGSVVTVQENTETVFVCRTSGGLPVATVRWYKEQRIPATSDDVEITNYASATSSKTNDDLLYVTSTLKYFPGKGDNGVKIYCTAKNSANTLLSGTKPQLNVQYSPDGPPTIVGFNNRETYSIIENSPGLLSCSVKGGNPLATLSWTCYNNGSAAETVGTTVTKAVTFTASRDQSRNCTCQSSHQVAGAQSVTVSVQVLYPPEIPRFKVKGSTVPGPISFIENKTRSVVCESKGNPNPDTYIWTKGGSTVRNGNMLTFSTVQKKDSGQYTCEAENTMIPSTGVRQTGTNRSTVHISVLYAPEIQELKTKDVVSGSHLNISCPVVKGNPPAMTFKWTRNDDIMEWNQQILYIETINKLDDKIYTCAVQNIMKPTGAEPQYGKDSGSFHLNVLYKASVTSFGVQGSEEPASVTVSENDNVTFVCTVDSNPDSNIEIKFQGKTLHKQENTNTLTFIHNNAACLDAGVYTCTAKNQYNNGEVSLKELTLYVRCKPRPLVPVKENVTSALRVSATLNFTGLAYPIPDQFTWEKENVTGWITLSNSSAILISTSGIDTYLTIKNVSQSDYVKYQLVVQNEVGSYNQTFQLIPEGVPETPKEFKTLEGYIMDRSVILQWKPGFSGGPEQTFILMYKRTSEQTWRNVTVKDTKDKTMNYTLNQLVSGSQYQAVIFARNRVGDSMSSRNTTFSTTEDVKEAGKSALIGGVAGGSSALIVIIIVIVVVVLQRRGFILKGKAHAREDSDDRKQVYTDENDYGMQDNPMYVSAGPRNQRPEGSGLGDASAVYSTVDKNRSVVDSRKNDVYAEVDKSKKTKANKGKKEKKEKSKDSFKKDGKNKKVMQEGDLYANATAAELEGTLAKQTKNDETIYENPEPSKPAAKKNVNKDGLIYADLTFNDQPKGQKKLVIHGLDSMTEYVQVDFTKKADPLPDSDDENNQPKK